MAGKRHPWGVTEVLLDGSYSTWSTHTTESAAEKAAEKRVETLVANGGQSDRGFDRRAVIEVRVHETRQRANTYGYDHPTRTLPVLGDVAYIGTRIDWFREILADLDKTVDAQISSHNSRPYGGFQYTSVEAQRAGVIHFLLDKLREIGGGGDAISERGFGRVNRETTTGEGKMAVGS